jgi:hypothetical protein
MTLFGLTIKPLKEAKKDLEAALQKGQELLRQTPVNYPCMVPPIQPKGLPEGSSRRIAYTYKKRSG